MDKAKSRIWELDALRGFCILWVIVVHLVFDLGTFLGVPLRLGPVFTAIQSYGGTVFVVLSGLCATLGHRSFRRGAVVFGCGMAITLVTLGMALLGLADRSIVIWFGVLHLLGVCMMLYPLLRRLPIYPAPFRIGQRLIESRFLHIYRRGKQPQQHPVGRI